MWWTLQCVFAVAWTTHGIFVGFVYEESITTLPLTIKMLWCHLGLITRREKCYAKLKTVPMQDVKTMSCMIAATDSDLISSFSIDYMHCVLMGTMKWKIMNFWLDKKNHEKPYYIEKKYQIALSNRLGNIKPISEHFRRCKYVSSHLEIVKEEFLLFRITVAVKLLLK